MQLSTEFAIDPQSPWVCKHNKESRAVMEAFKADRPIRVPVLCLEWYGQHGFYAKEVGLDYRKYYTDPDEMVRVQLETARRRRELPIHDDLPLGEAPDRWPVTVDLWPAIAPGAFGCPLLYRQDAVIAHHGLGLSREACDALDMPDPLRGGLLATMLKFFTDARDRYQRDALTFLGKPVGPVLAGVGTAGIFALAMDLRGGAIMEDMYEDPAFVHRFLRKLADWCDALTQTWATLQGQPVGPFEITDHGIDMLSPQLFEEFLVPIVLEMNRRRGTSVPTVLHHCGRGKQLFPVAKRRYGLTHINALTYPLNDIPKIRRDLGEDIRIDALIQDSIIQQGPPERIREVVKELLTGAKCHGRLAIMVGDLLPDTVIDHQIALYEAVREFGTY
jgi:uroporphyrinogen-III decarboxylase